MSLNLPSFPFRLALNPRADHAGAYGPRQDAVLNEAGLLQARHCISSWPAYAATPLVALPGLAAEMGIGQIYYKQEGERFELRSFKPLGGAYAVQRCLMRVVAAQTGREDIDPAEIVDGRHREIVSQVTVTAATDGNHGRSVAWGARMFGCRCVIFINQAVSANREAAISAYGAEVRRHPGSFDDAVRQTFATARAEGWHAIPDTGDDEALQAPRDVTQGYAVMTAEILEQLPVGERPSHVFLQAGVGGMAAATCAEFWRKFGIERPTTILVEPENAACWYASLTSGRPTAITGDIDSFMGGLSCGEVSTLAWEILQSGAHAALAIQDDAARAAMRVLAQGVNGDPGLVGGESGVAGLAGLLTSATDQPTREALGLNEQSCVVLIGSEGATDEAEYERVVGIPWRKVAS